MNSVGSDLYVDVTELRANIFRKDRPKDAFSPG